MLEFGTIAGGRQQESGSWLDVTSPWSGEVVGRVASADAKRVDGILRQSHATRVTLSRRGRADVLEAMAAAVEARRDEVARLITDESGLCLKDTTYEAGRVSDVLRFAAMKV